MRSWALNYLLVAGFSLGAVALLRAEEPAAPPKADPLDAAKNEAKPAADPAAKAAAPAAKYLRVKRDDANRPLALETAIARFVPAEGKGELTVDLVAAVHIGDKAYYQALNKRFEQYDVLLYELVAPQGTRIPKGGRREASGNPLAWLQDGMKSMLELDSQLEQVDYTRPNFVHADLSPDEMGEKMRERGDDALTVLLSATADLMREANRRERQARENPQAARRVPQFDPFSFFTDPQAGKKFKRTLAEEFDAQGDQAGTLGPTLGVMLISDRNAAALKVFQKQLAAGKKKIGIFYGAAHMPDFEKRLVADFGLKREKEEWLTAWDLK